MPTLKPKGTLIQPEIKTAIFGAAGSFSDLAAQKYCKDSGLTFIPEYHDEFTSVLTSVKNNKAARGVVPRKNSLTNLVLVSNKTIQDLDLLIKDTLTLRIEHCLLVLPKTMSSDIVSIASHPQAFLQCSSYLKRAWPKAGLIDYSSTAAAAKALHEGMLKSSTAVIASSEAASIYALKIHERKIQNDATNETEFAVVELR